MKIAALYFGQPRFVNNLNCFLSQKNKIFSQGEVDVFAHLWEPTNINYESSSWSGMQSCPSSEKDVEKFISTWKPKAFLSEPNRRFTNDELFSKLYNKIPGDSAKKKANFEISLSHFYSLEKVIDLFQTYKNEEYDWVVFLRTDLCIWDYPSLEKMEKGYFYFSSIFHFEHFADLSYITDPSYISGLKCFSFLNDPSFDDKKIMMANAESIKKATFLSKYSKDMLKQIPIPVRVVRDKTDIGKQW
jgi:hypothetical protein